MTVLEVIQRSTTYLSQKGVESPRRNIEEMLGQVLRLPRLQLYLNFERTLSETEVETLRGMVKRRAQREPLQHILGSVSFCGLEMAVGPQALVPRPETELLAERALRWLSRDQAGGMAVLRETAEPPVPPRQVTALDFGTGTGCLAVFLAVRAPALRVQAVDISAEALALARQNAAAHQVQERIEFHCGDGFQALPQDARFDLIVSNPPYVPNGEIEKLQPEVRDYDPRLALDGGPDGLLVLRRLAAEAKAWLHPGGKLMLEFGDGQAEALRELFLAEKWIVEAVEEDYSRRPRILIAGIA